MNEEEDLFGDDLDDEALLAACVEAEQDGDKDIFGEDDIDEEAMVSVCEEAEASIHEPASSPPRSTSPAPTEEHLSVLKRYFGHRTFKPAQWCVVRSLLSAADERDHCLVMATGYGKSLVYQFPAVFTGKTCLVVSPLIALMEDQVLALTTSGIAACSLGSSQQNKPNIHEEVAKGNYRVVYVTPEFIDSSLERLPNILPPSNLCLVAVDEAHCVSNWGHDFRAVYRKLYRIRTVYPKVPILALTATATDQVIKDIQQALHLRDPVVMKTSFDRPNLYIEVAPKSGSIWSDLSQLTEQRDAMSPRRFPGATIVYCPSKRDVESVTEELRSHGLNVAMYHAGMSIKAREESHHRFVRDQCDVIVCTVAFGMGINKPDVRMVIHYGAPRDMESYYQEIGRAGRDGQESRVKTFYSKADFSIHRHFLSDIADDNWRSHRGAMIHKMELYLSMKAGCRRVEILRHFEGSSASKSTLKERCCDNCSVALLSGQSETKAEEKVDFTAEALLLLEAVRACGGKFGLGVPCDVLKGSKVRFEWLNRLDVFGRGKHKSKQFWVELGRCLTTEGFIGHKSNHGQGKQKYLSYHVTARGLAALTPRSAVVIQLVPTNALKPASPKKFPAAMERIAAAVSVEEKSTRSKLVDSIKSLRNKLAAERSLAPYMIFSEELITQLAEVRPASLESLSKIGMAQAKIDMFGKRIVECISFWCESNAASTDNFAVLTTSEEEPLGSNLRSQLSTTQLESYVQFQDLGLDLSSVAAQRGLKTSTVSGHLCEALSLGLPVDVARLGVTDRRVAEIAAVIAAPTVDSCVHRLGPVKTACEESGLADVTWDEVRVAVTLLSVKHGVKDNRLQWDVKPSGDGDSAAQSQEAIEVPEKKEEDVKVVRPLPDWIKDAKENSEPAQKKMKKNSLFK